MDRKKMARIEQVMLEMGKLISTHPTTDAEVMRALIGIAASFALGGMVNNDMPTVKALRLLADIMEKANNEVDSITATVTH